MAWGTFSWKGPEGTGRSPGVTARMLVGELTALESPAHIDTWQAKQADDDADAGAGRRKRLADQPTWRPA